jgi:hypothetical protein
MLYGYPGRPRGGEALESSYRSSVRSTNAVPHVSAVVASQHLRVSQRTHPEGNKRPQGPCSGSTTTRASDSSHRMTPASTRSELHNKGRTDMASSGKKKTTMAKLTRESRLRERRQDKQARKDARKHASAHPPDGPDDTLNATTGESAEAGTGQPALETAVQTLADA